MISFKQFLKESKNVHMEHIEEIIFVSGLSGAQEAINILLDFKNQLSGKSTSKVACQVKHDGAPAIIAGIDPSDGKFFIGTKGVFNKNPKVIKKLSDISDLGYKGGLASKLEISFKYLPKLEIKDILQGDILFTQEDLKQKTIDGEEYITFQPNTILYAVPIQSNLAKQIKRAKLGLVWHTLYSGDSLSNLSLSYNFNIDKLKRTPDVWYDDTFYKDVSGTVLLSKSEEETINNYLTQASKIINSINEKELQSFIDIQQEYKLKGWSLNNYMNFNIRNNTISNSAKDYISWLENKLNENILKLKSDDARNKKMGEVKTIINNMKQYTKLIDQIINYQKNIIAAKNIIVHKIDSGLNSLKKTFIQTSNGYKVTGAEGFVAINHLGNNGVKLVDRLEFSRMNFLAIKNWS